MGAMRFGEVLGLLYVRIKSYGCLSYGCSFGKQAAMA